MDTLPAWVKLAEAIATILSSVGVVIALIQLRISGNQFHTQLRISSEQFHTQLQSSTNQFQTQLKLTQDQFKLINQGFVKMTMTHVMYSNQITDISQLRPVDSDTLYQSVEPRVNLENVGNLPVKMEIKEFKAFFDDHEVYSAPQELLDKCTETIHPKTKQDFSLGAFGLGSQTGLHIAEIDALNVSFKILIEYHDYYDQEKRIKTIDRIVRLSGVSLYSFLNNDKL